MSTPFLSDYLPVVTATADVPANPVTDPGTSPEMIAFCYDAEAGELSFWDPISETRLTVQLSGALSFTAAEISYDHVVSGLAATDVQAAIDEIDATVDALGSPPADTDDLPEGAMNLYFTNARADAAVNGNIDTTYFAANVIDTDVALAADSDLRLATQKAVKAYVDASGGGSPASTTEVLTGTDSSKIVTPDALAALWEKGSDITSAATISVGEGGFFDVTGTTGISDIDFATDKSGRIAWLQFDGALTITHSSTLILPGARDIVTQAGDVIGFVSEGTADTVRCIQVLRAKGAAIELITETVTAGSAASVSFSSIPATYRDLEIRVRGRGDNASTDVEICYQFNGDTTSGHYNYMNAFIQNGGAGATSSASAARIQAGFLPAASATASYAGGHKISVLDYRGTTFFKDTIGNGGEAKTSATANHNAQISHGNWLDTSAITSILVFLSAGNFVDGSVVSLYGHR